MITASRKRTVRTAVALGTADQSCFAWNHTTVLTIVITVTGIQFSKKETVCTLISRGEMNRNPLIADKPGAALSPADAKLHQLFTVFYFYWCSVNLLAIVPEFVKSFSLIGCEAFPFDFFCHCGFSCSEKPKRRNPSWLICLVYI